MNNLIDVLDADGFFTGIQMPRNEIHANGLFHRAIHVYLFDPDGKLLLQRRAADLDNYPGALSISVVGHVDAGEGSSAAAKREILEELQIEATTYSLEFMFSVKQEAVIAKDYIDRQFNDIFIAHSFLPLNKVKFDSKEVASTQLVEFSEFLSLVEKDKDLLFKVYAKEIAMLRHYLRR